MESLCRSIAGEKMIAAGIGEMFNVPIYGYNRT
jgi:hypothetical protein